MLQFSNPAALWFLTLIIPVVLLYLLKRRRQDYIVPSTFLWKQVIDDSQAYTPFQRLRSSLLMLLQILIIVLFTAILAQPYFAGVSKQSRKWVLVMDRSASMQATDERPSRFEKAKEKLNSSLQSIPPVDEIMLISAGSSVDILQNFTLSHDAISRKLREVEPEDTAADWSQVILILKPLLKESPKPAVLIASDFANFRMADSLPFTPLQVGRAIDNIAITKASLEDAAPDFLNQVLYFQLKNYSINKKDVDVEIRAGQTLLNAFTIPIPPGSSAEKTLPINVPDGVPIKILMENADRFALDNDFTLISHPHQTINVRLESTNPFLRRALQVLPSVRITDAASIVLSESNQTESGIYFLKGNRAKTAAMIQWNQASAPLRFVDAGLWQISNYQLLDLPAGGQPLMETAEGLVAYSISAGTRRQVVLGFQVDDSNLPVLAGFPIFIQNSLLWIDEGLHPQLPTVTDRERPKEGMIAEDKGYVNFADDQESNLTPQRVSGEARPDNQIVMVRQDFSEWFLIALLATIMLEWWAFHRRG
jgi:aerotolerance regulator-like protein/VWA domain-containing protein